jgi:phage repressor protein C with HTH and peptisase S24 domain
MDVFATDPVRALIARRLKDLGLTLSGVSRAIGRNHAYLQQYIERGIPAELPEKVRPLLAAQLHLEEGQLRRDSRGASASAASDGLAEGGVPDTVTVAHTPELANMSHDVPILGVARGGRPGEGDFRFNGEIAGVTARPHGLRGIKEPFCIFVQGDSMAPWRNEGERVYINPARPARPGDHVVVELKPERDGEPGVAWLKKLVARSPDGSLVLAQYNPATSRIKIPGAKVKRVFRVMEWEELLVG